MAPGAWWSETRKGPHFSTEKESLKHKRDTLVASRGEFPTRLRDRQSLLSSQVIAQGGSSTEFRNALPAPAGSPCARLPGRLVESRSEQLPL